MILFVALSFVSALWYNSHMPIIQYTGKTVLQKETIAAIQKESRSLVANKDVAGAWLSSKHIKQQIALLSQEEAASVLPEYRRITAGLKVLALPVLPQEEVINLLKNNLEFLDTQSEPLLSAGLSAWLAGQPDEAQEQIKTTFRSIIDPDSPFAPKLLSMLAPAQAVGERTVAQADDLLNANERADISRSSVKAEAVVQPFSSENAIDSTSRTIFSFSGSKESEQLFVKRTQALVRSRVRDVRSAAEFADYASRPFAAGGLGLSGETLANAERVTEEAYGRSHGIARATAPVQVAQQPMLVATQAMNEQPKDGVAKKQESTSQKELDALIQQGASDATFAHILQKPAIPKPVTPAIPSAQKPKFPLPMPMRTPKPPLPMQSPKPQFQPPESIRMPRRSNSSTKPRLDDVMPAPAFAGINSPSRLAESDNRTMGLSDELGTITLADFRSLGDSPHATQTIIGKIATLEGESVSQKFDGIRAFRASPLFESYLTIGDASLSGGKKLSAVLADPSLNSETMTEDEFFAIADLASKLK